MRSSPPGLFLVAAAVCVHAGREGAGREGAGRKRKMGVVSKVKGDY